MSTIATLWILVFTAVPSGVRGDLNFGTFLTKEDCQKDVAKVNKAYGTINYPQYWKCVPYQVATS